MYKFLTVFLSIFILIFLSSNTTLAKKISRDNAQYTGKALVDVQTMTNAGEWYFVMIQCESKFSQNFRDELGSLSWEDYRNWLTGYSKYSSGYRTPTCDDDYDDIKAWYSDIIRYIKQELNYKDSDLNQNKSDKQNNDTKEQLKKLKDLYDEGLITLEEYEAKKKEIIDNI